VLFGAILILTGLKMLSQRGHHASKPPRLPGFLSHGSRAPLAAIILADVIFAVDSIPAAFAVTTQTFLVIAANAFAILGLRPTYVLLAGGLDRFRHLGTGVALVLVLIGVKLAIEGAVHVPSWVSLVGVIAILGSSVLLSLRSPDTERVLR
jgi:tellurite resistance protein TerC